MSAGTPPCIPLPPALMCVSLSAGSIEGHQVLNTENLWVNGAGALPLEKGFSRELTQSLPPASLNTNMHTHRQDTYIHVHIHIHKSHMFVHMHNVLHMCRCGYMHEFGVQMCIQACFLVWINMHTHVHTCMCVALWVHTF